MANYIIHLTYLDSQPNGAFDVMYPLEAPDQASAVIAGNELRDAIAPLTQCTLGFQSVELVISRSRTRPTGNIDGEKKALFPFVTQAGKIMTRTIPAINPNYFVPNTDLVDMTDPDVQGYTGVVIDSGFEDSNNSDIIAVEQAVKQFRNRQK